jgi:hypothetical protein
MLKEEKAEVKKLCEYLKSLGLFYYAIPAIPFNPRFGGIPIGYKKGMPDICVPLYKLYFEMKTIKAGKVKAHEENQFKIHEQLRKSGCKVFRCEGFEVAKNIVDTLFFNP